MEPLQQQRRPHNPGQFWGDGVLLLGSLETFAHILPVDHVPDGLDIVWPHIFVLEIVGVFPHIDAKERDETCE